MRLGCCIVLAVGCAVVPAVMAKGNLSVAETGFDCDDTSCAVSTKVTNHTGSDFSGFLHIYGYRSDGANQNDELVAEQYRYFSIRENKSVDMTMKTGFAEKPQYFEASIRSNRYYGWMGACEDSMSGFDIDGGRFTSYAKMWSPTGDSYRKTQGSIEKIGDNRFRVEPGDKSGQFVVTYKPDSFRLYALDEKTGQQIGYYQACDIEEAENIMDKFKR